MKSNQTVREGGTVFHARQNHYYERRTNDKAWIAYRYWRNEQEREFVVSDTGQEEVSAADCSTDLALVFWVGNCLL